MSLKQVILVICSNNFIFWIGDLLASETGFPRVFKKIFSFFYIWDLFVTETGFPCIFKNIFSFFYIGDLFVTFFLLFFGLGIFLSVKQDFLVIFYSNISLFRFGICLSVKQDFLVIFFFFKYFPLLDLGFAWLRTLAGKSAEKMLNPQNSICSAAVSSARKHC